MQNTDYLNKIEEIIDKKRKANPLTQEYNNLLGEAFPIKQFEDVFKLGYVYMLSTIKKDMSKYLCKDCNEYINIVIEANKNDDVMSLYFDKLLG